MTHNLRPDDRSPEYWRRMASDEEAAAALPEPSLQDPVAVGQMFCNALGQYRHFQVALRRIVTPESVAAWGDFSDAANFLASIPDAGYGSMAQRAVGADDVAYFKVLSGVTDSYQVLDEQIVQAAGIVTLAWRPEFGEWRVHAMGSNYVVPEQVPH
ncbi:hypothetical protein [Arthrobacter sp. efr-133-R2A-120]|uniref:hypothetical protein n=1 Tax=Arthrobacter sp. efr-133-R2A-120 TaxID=3040277 RepID=UPI00254C204D|nr:hypothetical protein [Arthrobacter sp. efr-133-R2A-120]